MFGFALAPQGRADQEDAKMSDADFDTQEFDSQEYETNAEKEDPSAQEDGDDGNDAASADDNDNGGEVSAMTRRVGEVSFKDLYRRKKTPGDLKAIIQSSKVNFDLREKTGPLRYAVDQQEELMATSDHLRTASNARLKHFLDLQNARIGKANKRFVSGTALVTSKTHSIPSIPLSTYHRVQQVQWENAILWGDETDSPAPFVPEEDDNPFMSSSKPTAQSSISLARQSTARPVSDVFEFKDDGFDITCPRHYRWEMARAPKTVVSQEAIGTTKKASLPCALNPALVDASWLDAIGWDDTMEMPPSRVLLDENDVHLVLSNPLVESVRATLRIPERKLGAIEIKKEELKKQKGLKEDRIKDVMGKLELGTDTAESRIGEAKRSKDTRIIKNMGHVHHSLPAIKLSMTKPELPLSKLREFHRPRGKFKIHERMLVVSSKEAEKSKNSSLKLTEADLANDPTLSQIKKPSDLNPTAGGKLILLEYTEQHPPMLANPGMAARVLHYWRPPEVPPEEAKGKKKTKPIPPTVSMGQVVTLGENEDSPFVGDVPAGKMVTSFNSKLFKFPIFNHKPRSSFLEAEDKYDFFLVARSVSKKGKGSSSTTMMYLMELPPLYVAGQVEPQIEVPAPNSRSANEFIRPYMSFHILRLFKKTSDGERLKIEDITRAFPNQSGTAIRKRMKEVAMFERGGNDSGWWKKKSPAELITEEEIRASVSPEAVCLYESMMSGHQRLLDMGLTKQFTPTGVQTAIAHMMKRLKFREQLMSSKILGGLTGRALADEEKKLWNRDPVLVNLRNDIQIARSINEQLLLTPWNLTNGYVECHLQGKGSGMLLLGGVGDPSARGEGFSFVRVPQSRAKKKEGGEELISDEAAVQKAVAAVTGTTADLRKLKMKEAGDVLKNLGMSDTDIAKLRRWDRIYMVRELSTRASAHGLAGGLTKFVRGARKSLNAQQQEYRRKCDVIYDRQLEVLSATKTDFQDDSDSDSEEDDDFIEDLEDDLLGEDLATAANNRGPKDIFKAGSGGLNRTKTTLLERDDAAELRRLKEDMKEGGTAASSAGGRISRPEVDASHLRSQLKASGIKDSISGVSSMASTKGNSVASSAMPSPAEPASRAQSPRSGGASSMSMQSGFGSAVSGRQAIKRTTRIIEEDGTETVKIEFIVDPKHIGRFKAAQKFKERQAKDEERNQLRKRKKMEDAENDQSLLKKQISDELKALKKKEETTRGYVEMLEKGQDVSAGGRGVIKCTACGQIGHIRTNRNCPLFIESKNEVAGKIKADAPLKLTLKKSNLEDLMKDDNSLTVNLADLREGARKHQAEKKRKRMQDVAESAELYKKQYKDKKAEAVRLPIARLNGLLEQVLFTLLGMPESQLFRDPVDGNAVRDYYTIIKRPMDLRRMRQKVSDLAYDSMRDFLADVELMATNSKMYNGELNPITKNAFKLLEKAKDDLTQLNADGAMHSLQKLARAQSVST
ncbi:Aste57867_13083 [Aphanomyces stellatus]|uniref:Aste57867_13083 protein n=1 Tax=Aphanomyces stellatus TaxID=120398 RepID=A0A485KZB5_9STRA|nr:hypothetical protein As57867_013035 [Aphanomyces stellatus]VFT89927.1 Aste57867_13083 [Aphanomyces stellatus]